MGGVCGVSYIGNPRPNTAMYVTAKVGYLVSNLAGVSGCLIFAENGIDVPDSIAKANEFRFCDNPLLAYADYAGTIERARIAAERTIPYLQTETGAFVSETAVLGKGAYLEPGVMIGPGVEIGEGAVILSGAVVRHARIGNNVLINEHAVVGAAGFTMASDEEGNLLRIPTLGGVLVGDDVEIGVHDNVSCGSGGDTIINNRAKIDALVHIGHDAIIGRNVRITAGVVVGGYASVGEGAFLGVGSVLRNRIIIGENVTIGMGAVVTKSVDDGITVVGNPAKPFERKR